MAWNVVGIIAIILLIFSFKLGQNAIWGTFTIAILVCIVWGIVNLVSGDPINWPIFKRICIVSVLLGGFFEILPFAFKKLAKRR